MLECLQIACIAPLHHGCVAAEIEEEEEEGVVQLRHHTDSSFAPVPVQLSTATLNVKGQAVSKRRSVVTVRMYQALIGLRCMQSGQDISRFSADHPSRISWQTWHHTLLLTSISSFHNVRTVQQDC